MRHVVWGLVAVLVLLAAPVFAGEDAKALRKELMDLTRQLRAAERKAYGTEDIKELQKKVMEARRAYEKAAGEIAEIKEVNDKLAELRKEQYKLMKQRHELMKKNAEALAEPKKAMDDAQAAVKGALAEIPAIKELLAKKAELDKKIKDLRGVRKPRTDRPKNPRKKPKPKPEAGAGAADM